LWFDLIYFFGKPVSDHQRYILAKKIARGGMAEIWLAKQSGEDGFQRLCAIKRILPHYAQEKEFIEMFRDEAHIGKRLQHANIVRVEGFEEVDGAFAIIMEFVDGSDLRTVLSTCEKMQSRISVPAAVFIAAEVARGLHYSHTKVDEITQKPLEIVHRDISPQNILLSYEGEVKITDFGIADAESKMTETKPGVVKGKYAYMSPEQIAGKSVDGRTDVFALAVVLWEMLAMRRLFAAENEVDTIQLVKNCKIPETPKQANPEVDNELDDITMRALARDSRKRYNTAEEFEKDLRRYLSQKFPGFTGSDLGAFLKRVMAEKRGESAAEIKKTLTATNLKSATRTGRKRAAMPQPATDSAVKAAVGSEVKTPDEAAPPVSAPVLSIVKSPSMGPGHNSALSRSPINTNYRGPTSQNSPPHSQKKRLPKKPEPSPLPKLAAVAILTLALAAAAFLFDVPQKLLARDPAFVMITSSPQVVKVAINGKAAFAGEFQRAPIKIELPPGKHTLKIYRPGYDAETFEAETESGKVLRKRIKLKAVAPFAPTRIDVTNMGNLSAVYINVDEGFDGGIISAKKNTKPLLKDLAADREHILEVADATKKVKLFGCKFTPRAVTEKEPTYVLIDIVRRKCIERNPL